MGEWVDYWYDGERLVAQLHRGWGFPAWCREQEAASRRDIDALLARAWVETFPDDETLRMKW